MTPERWRKVGELFDSALRLAPDRRAHYLEEACAGDEGLRREVESLIAHDGEKDFPPGAALADAARALSVMHAGSLIGHELGAYKIVSLLGAGGMGEVYLAEDGRLGRRVALKLLPLSVSEDGERLRRFEQEARAASALNHPNILTIYELGHEGRRRFIAAEFIEGETLRQRLARAPLEIDEALEVAVQVASALSAAHKAGITHRDIKPENLMLRPDGVVKVLDFGLAKPVARDGDDAQPTTSPRSAVRTSPGVVMGTVAYMSPEQARGLPVDERTDVWSLGVVMYEMAAARQPFAGATPTDVVISIAGRDPAPLAECAPGVPAGLERIVQKALAKDREGRYRTAEEMLADLKRLRRRLEIGAEVGRSGESTLGSVPAVTMSKGGVITARLFPLGLTRSRLLTLAAIAGVLVIAGLLSALFFRRGATPRSEIKSLAVLPLKSLNSEVSDDYLGLGIADTIITKVSQVDGLVVRPTSAVRQYADQQIDSLEAARQLQADSVLDGTFLRAGDRLRVSVNLLRARDGASLWAETFDVRFTDIFEIQDEVSRGVAARLRLKLSSAEQARLAKRHTTDPEAYSYYTKAMYHFSKRGFSGDPQEEAEVAIDLFKEAVELDPNYALAHAQLGYAYAWVADFKEGGPGLVASAKEELRVAERLDPQLAEVHVARSFIAWSHYEDWQTEAAIREARLAKQLDPSVANPVLAALYFHVGLEEQAAKEFELALERDPTSDTVKRAYLSMYSLLAEPDEWLALNQRLFNRGPDVRYYLEKGMLGEAAPLIEQEYLENPDEPGPRRDKALWLALQGKHKEAQAAVPRIVEKVRRDKAYHHFTYDIARIYALDGKSDAALEWMRRTVDDGFPCYTLFARDSFLDPIRKDPAFIQFMALMKTRWEGYRREFG